MALVFSAFGISILCIPRAGHRRQVALLSPSGKRDIEIEKDIYSTNSISNVTANDLKLSNQK